MAEASTWGELAILFRRVAESDPMWRAWGSTVEPLLVTLAEKTGIRLLEHPRDRSDVRLVALAIYYRCMASEAQDAVMAAFRRMEGRSGKKVKPPPEVLRVVDGQD